MHTAGLPPLVAGSGVPCRVQPASCRVPGGPLQTDRHPCAAQAILQWRRQALISAAHHAIHAHNSALGARRSEQRGSRIPGHAGHRATVCLHLTQHAAPRRGGVDHTQCAPGLGRRQDQEGRVRGGAQRTAALQGSHASSRTATASQVQAACAQQVGCTQPQGAVGVRPMRMLCSFLLPWPKFLACLGTTTILRTGGAPMPPGCAKHAKFRPVCPWSLARIPEMHRPLKGTVQQHFSVGCAARPRGDSILSAWPSAGYSTKLWPQSPQWQAACSLTADD